MSGEQSYRRSVDLARFVAAVGIVWDHARAPYADIGYLALSLFLVLTSYLAVGSYLRSEGKGFWFSRMQRIAVPWLVWCVVYRIVFEVVLHEPFRLLSEPWSLLIGPSIHLWFLPFVMVALVLIGPLCRWVTNARSLSVASAGLIVLSVPLGLLHAEVAPLAWFTDTGPLPQPIPQWFYSLPLFLFGALLALAQRMGLMWVPMVTAAVISAVLTLRAPEFASVQMILVGLVFLAVWRVTITAAWPTALAGHAFGIYLLHPAVMLLAYKLFGAEVDRVQAALFTIAVSWGLTIALQRLPWVQRFV
ncbi:MAG: acyltransferase family protein [Paracoccaceae bacterium]